MLAAERERARSKGYLTIDQVDYTVDRWEDLANEYFTKARDAVKSLDEDGDGDIDLDDVQKKLMNYVSIGVGWLDAFRSKHDR